ncbi:MAG TPA: CBS domain-containing protein [Thermoflexia bacterium]|nr:CBS domain-containing protein [Thermoflexia bacterium]
MEVILTHENADFDAIASLLGAHKLFPDAVPVLPRRINRNCRAFLSLYGAEFPFVHPDDLPRRRIRRAILVDTQNLTSLKGMARDVRVDIIDHHKLDRDLPEGWTFSGEPLGATTTLLVEELARRSCSLSRVEATLLLMGIYEDTGSLSFPDTTPRDVRAAAWLLERGANLSVANEFLHHPLTPGQQWLYERLLDEATTHEVGGHSIVVAAVEAPDYREEISTLAHKLWDVLEPSALFVLVSLNDHVQMVARSTTDDINVADIAAHFGGGGHARAAAALIRNRSLRSVRAELLDLLPRHVRPAVTVEQIMSRGVQVLSPDTTVAEANDRMRRTGHEGYPVVEGGKVVGLLTRRAVDRAIQFGMAAAPVRQVMEPGSVTVSPKDSVEKLRRLMIETGWGQVPVVEDGKIVGVVTRTDLITLWGAVPNHSQQVQRIRALLEEALPPQTLALVRRIAETAREMGYSLYFVGGLVRDLLLGTPVVDVDLVVEGDAIRLARRLARQLGGRVVAHRRFGTAKWLIGQGVWQAVAGGPPPPDRTPRSIDFATARTEFYTHPTALPEVERSSIKQDLHRRDFTINTLAIRLDPPHWGELLDFYGGEADLRNGVIRVLHSLSFIDDPTRILRAARLEARLGFRLDPRSESLIANALPLLDRVSGDRIRHELEQILDEREPEKALCRLEELGVLRQIHSNLRCDAWVQARFRTAREELEPEVWELEPEDHRFVLWGLLFYRLDPESLEAVLRRLKMPRSEADDLRMLPDLRRAMRRLAPARRPSRIYRALRPFPSRLLAVAWVACEGEGLREKMLRYQTQYRHVRTALTGDDLKAMGLRPGPLFGRLLSVVRDARLDGVVTTREEEEALVRRMLRRLGSEDP